MALRVPLSFAAGQQQEQPASSSSASLNWAGYVADQGDYTSVTGSWVVPSVSASDALGPADATWVGIGGVNSADLIQAGTEALVDHGGVEYQAWYETLPNVSMAVPLAVSAGDSMTTTISEVGPAQWHITIRDNTTGQEYNRTFVYDSSHSSAEWVEERVSDIDGSFLPLDDFGSVKFFNSFATNNGVQESLSQLGARPLSMINGVHRLLATTSDIDATTGSFSVTRATPTTPANVRPQYATAPTEPRVVDISPADDSGSPYIVVTFFSNASEAYPTAAYHHWRARR